jgi:NH3-dependent NAD+ synthetase
MKTMLTGVYMGTNNSSDATKNAARFLMEGGVDPKTGEIVAGIGGKFEIRNVQDLLDFYGTMFAVEDTAGMDPLEKYNMVTEIGALLNASAALTTPEQRAEMAQKLKAKYPRIKDLINAVEDSTTYENIQARGRQVLIMLFANKERKMAIANPNLDEARNAYATFGGDLHSGTINLNGFLNKALQLDIMKYLYSFGVHGVMGPIRALGPILGNKPTAELLPKGADGSVVQNDEDALQRSFPQMDRLAELMLYERKQTKNGARRLNAREVFEILKTDPLFDKVDENRLYNMVRLTYLRYYGPSQNKIHATPIGPTFGRNVDHQTSMRTPNLNGLSKDELALLGLDLMFKWAEEDGLALSSAERKILEKRAQQDEKFIRDFDALVWSGSDTMEYDLRRAYETVKAKGWNKLFSPLPERHPIRVICALAPALD